MTAPEYGGNEFAVRPLVVAIKARHLEPSAAELWARYTRMRTLNERLETIALEELLAQHEFEIQGALQRFDRLLGIERTYRAHVVITIEGDVEVGAVTESDAHDLAESGIGCGDIPVWLGAGGFNVTRIYTSGATRA